MTPTGPGPVRSVNNELTRSRPHVRPRRDGALLLASDRASAPTPARPDTADSEASTRGCPSTALPNAALIAPRHQPHEGPLRVLIGKEQFSENHAWSEMPQHWRRPALPAAS